MPVSKKSSRAGARSSRSGGGRTKTGGGESGGGGSGGGGGGTGSGSSRNSSPVPFGQFDVGGGADRRGPAMMGGNSMPIGQAATLFPGTPIGQADRPSKAGGPAKPAIPLAAARRMEQQQTQLSEAKPEEEKADPSTAEPPTDSEELQPYPKHPLENAWTLWYFKQDKSVRNWEDNQKKVHSVSYAEDFWSLYNHIESASDIPSGCDYSLFKEDIKPMWEDKKNEKGGKWVVKVEKHHRANCLENMWLEVLLCLIGDMFPAQGRLVNGAVVNVRPKVDRISLWLSEVNAEKEIIDIGKHLKDILDFDGRIEFEVHAETATKKSSFVRSKYDV